MAGPPPNDRGRYEQMLRDMVGGGRAPSPSPRVHLRPNRSLREMGRTTPAVRTPHFLAFLVLLSLCVIGVSLYIFKVSNGSYGLVGFCLSLLLLLVCVVANGSGSSRDPISRSILNITGLASFVSCFALLALPDVHQVIYHLTLTQLVSGMIVVAAIFSVVRPTNRLGNVTLAALAGTCAVLQYAYGRQEDFRYIPFLSPDAYALTNNVLVWTLVAVAVLALLLGVADSPKLNQTVVLVVASIYAMFQFSFGYQEILHTFSLQTNSSSAVISAIYLNMVLVYGPIIVTLLVLLFARQSPRLEQSPMLILAVVSACMLNFRGAGVSIPLLPSDTHPLAIQIGDLLTVNQFIMYGLVIASLVLFVLFLFTNFPSNFTWIDYAALCITALACSQLQSFFWQSNTQMGTLSASDVAQSTFNELFVEISNQLVAGGLMLVIVIRLCIAFIMLFLPLIRRYSPIEELVRDLLNRFPQINHLALWIDRALLLGATVTCALLEGFFGERGPIPVYTFRVQRIVFTPHQLLAILFAIFAFIMLARLHKPFARGDRFVLLLDAVVGVSFFFGKSKPLLPFSLATQRSIDSLFHIIPPNILFSAALLAVALISFHWLGRSKSVGDRKVLQIIFRIALICICLQFVIPSLLFTLPALLALILGVIVATV